MVAECIEKWKKEERRREEKRRKTEESRVNGGRECEKKKTRISPRCWRRGCAAVILARRPSGVARARVCRRESKKNKKKKITIRLETQAKEEVALGVLQNRDAHLLTRI